MRQEAEQGQADQTPPSFLVTRRRQRRPAAPSLSPVVPLPSPSAAAAAEFAQGQDLSRPASFSSSRRSSADTVSSATRRALLSVLSSDQSPQVEEDDYLIVHHREPSSLTTNKIQPRLSSSSYSRKHLDIVLGDEHSHLDRLPGHIGMRRGKRIRPVSADSFSLLPSPSAPSPAKVNKLQPDEAPVDEVPKKKNRRILCNVQDQTISPLLAKQSAVAIAPQKTLRAKDRKKVAEATLLQSQQGLQLLKSTSLKDRKC